MSRHHPLLLLLVLLATIVAACAGWDRPWASASRPLVYVAIGASDSVGVGAVSPESDGWVPRFHQQLPPGTALLNLGLSSSLLSQALEQQLPVAVAAKPDVVTVWLAVNDLNARVPLEAYSRDLDRLLAALDPGHTLVLVANVPDLTAAPAYRAVDPNRLHLAVGQWNAAIGNVVQQRGAVLVDLSNTWQELGRDPGLISPDGFHPSSEGYARVSDRFVAAFEAHRARLAVNGV